MYLLAFDVFRYLERLAPFPEMGSPLGYRYPKPDGFRQVIYKRWLRIIYEFDGTENTVFFLAIRDCSQEMQTRREPKRDMPRTKNYFSTEPNKS